ncbi:alpha/beta fold hydrolase [Aquimarina sp. RZ0]|uniref:alpha/beta fold hydrolase n=1 Tax=Aquimarina sp. RZ0 TaxID=2607730 RepID=UPI0011F0FFA6|nr:alpha/beta fold hydrolase [Aquimarina sp. RZ0]KAA1244949.1 alpha/beta hydrolase [Aquimarina sp. RZ0]
MHSITKKYIQIGTKKVFVQILGTGPAIALLHPSPHSSNMLLPLAQQLAENYTVICIDTPGYGKSDPLEEAPKNVGVYTKVIHKLFKVLGLERIALYGTATGAQIAIRYSLKYPEDISHLFLDNSAHFNDDFRADILKHYFPDFTPQMDGSHLTKIWTMVSHMVQYFPWCFQKDEYALNRPSISAEVLQIISMDYLKTGMTYHYAYKVAFEHERAEYVQQLEVSTSIFRWNGSIIAQYIDDLIKHDMPPNVQVLYIEGNPDERVNVMTEHMKSKALNLSEVVLDFSSEIQVKPKAILYKTNDKSVPQVESDGSHFLKAWTILKKYNVSFNAKKLQTCLVDWYANE